MQRSCKFLKTSLLNLIKALGEWCKTHYIYIYNIIYIIYCVVINLLHMSVYQECLSIILMGILYLISFKWIEEYKKEKAKFENQFPVLDKRFTQIEGNHIYVDKDKQSEIILYLYSVENYFEKLGYYK